MRQNPPRGRRGTAEPAQGVEAKALVPGASSTRRGELLRSELRRTRGPRYKAGAKKEGEERQERQERQKGRRGRNGKSGTEAAQATAHKSSELGADAKSPRGAAPRARWLAAARGVRGIVLGGDIHVAHVEIACKSECRELADLPLSAVR